VSSYQLSVISFNVTSYNQFHQSNQWKIFNLSLMKTSQIFILFIFLTINVLAQKSTISGYIKDEKTGEKLVGATIAMPELEIGTYSNNYGFYSITLPQKDSVLVIFSYVGYQTIAKKCPLKEDLDLTIILSQTPIEGEEVVITDNKARKNVEQATMGVIDIPIEQVEMLPFLSGEKDLLKVIQLLPGVQAGGEGSSGFYVRGGQADQNLILMDEAIVYNPFHLAGYLSVFNSDAIRNITLHKGSFPAQYGGRLSSILDIQMKEGNNQKWTGEAAIGAISSKATIEGPIIKNRASAIVSYRRFYWDLFVKPFLRPGQELAYNFQDLNAKINFKISDKDHIFLSGYYGGDRLVQGQTTPVDTTKFSTKWGNSTFTARWNHLFSNKLFANTSFIYSKYDFNIGQTLQSLSIRMSSGIEDWNGKIDFDYFPHPKHKVKFGVNYFYHTFTPSSVKGKVGTVKTETTQSKYVHESAAYINDEWTVTDLFSLNLGLRLPFFVYKNTKYWSAEPRVTTKYQLNENASIKAGYTFMNQYSHLVSSSAISLPFDLWIPSTDTVKPQKAHQVAVGYFQNLFGDRYEGSVEIYYKHMANQIDYRQGANFYFNSNYQKELVFGKSWSYGAEFFLRKRVGRFNGWLSYTLSWTWRQFDKLNNNIPFPAKYDRRHNLSVVNIYKFNDRWSFASVFVFTTGNTLTLPDGRIYSPLSNNGYGQVWVSDYVAKNGYRLKSYNRLDIGLRYKLNWKNVDSELHIDIYNVYNRRNPFFLYLTQERDPQSGGTKFVAKQISLLPMIPSLTLQMKF